MARTNKSVYLVLGLLADRPKSGYDIKQEVEEVIGHFWKESFGQIYPVLARLAREGLVKKGKSTNGGRQRNVFAITAKGRLELDQWLRLPPEPESVRSELLLKVFFGHVVPPTVLVAHLEAFRERNKAFRQLLARGASELEAEKMAPEARQAIALSMRLGDLVAQARLKWADEAIRELTSR